jgi:hypothetical protein
MLCCIAASSAPSVPATALARSVRYDVEQERGRRESARTILALGSAPPRPSSRAMLAQRAPLHAAATPRPRLAARRAPRVCCASGSKPRDAPASPFDALQGRRVFRATDGQPVALTSLWSGEQTAVVTFFRSLG